MHDSQAAQPRVLLVDDSRVMRKAIAHVLRQEFEVLECEDGEAAWSLVAAQSVDLIITDVEMPRLDGYGLLARVRSAQNSQLRDTPVVVITGGDDEATKLRALDAGASDFIVKPIDRTQLLARVRGQVKLERANRALILRAEEETLVDSDTGLVNKRGLLQTGTAALAYARRHQHTLAVIRFNLLLSGSTRPLPEIAAWLRTRVRQEETVAHLGNGAFALVAPCEDTVEARALTQRLQRELEHTALLFQAPLGLFGSTCEGVPDEDIDDWLARAEHVLTEPRAPAPEATPVAALDSAAGMSPIPLASDISLPEAPPSLAAALEALAAGHSAPLLPHLKLLVTEVLPLLELCNQTHRLGLAFALRSLREKLARLPGEERAPPLQERPVRV